MDILVRLCLFVFNWISTMTNSCSVPKYVFWITDYPKTASGKIQKYKLREDGAQLVKDGKGLD